MCGRGSAATVPKGIEIVLFIVVAMLIILVVAGLVLTYVAYPHRGEDVPRAPWVSDTMTRLARRAPVLSEEDETPRFDLLKR
jgi:hypothetical protein